MRNIKLTLSYDGGGYHGFQKQKGTGLPTIQEELEKALSILAQESIAVIGSGRTDAGVHAKGQVANFKSSMRIPAERLPLALNSLLPRDIVVFKAEDVSCDFHARYDAKRKTYCYTIYNDSCLSPFWRRYAYHVPGKLKLEEMSAAARFFLGEHDFHGFCAKDTAVKDFVRTIDECSVKKDDEIIRIIVAGDGFLYNMVRIMVGTILEIGKGKRKPQDVAYLLQKGVREEAGMTLPSCGLCLQKVEYPS